VKHSCDSGTTVFINHLDLSFLLLLLLPGTQAVLFVKVVFYYSEGGLLKLICRESATLCHYARTLKFGTLGVMDTISFPLSATSDGKTKDVPAIQRLVRLIH